MIVPYEYNIYIYMIIYIYGYNFIKRPFPGPTYLFLGCYRFLFVTHEYHIIATYAWDSNPKALGCGVPQNSSETNGLGIHVDLGDSQPRLVIRGYQGRWVGGGWISGSSIHCRVHGSLTRIMNCWPSSIRADWNDLLWHRVGSWPAVASNFPWWCMHIYIPVYRYR